MASEGTGPTAPAGEATEYRKAAVLFKRLIE